MKFITLSVLLISSVQALGATCTKYRPSRGLDSLLEFTTFPGKQHAHFSVRRCDNGGPFTCHYESDAVYKMEFRPTRLNIWDLQKVSGEGPETLVWEEFKVFTPPHPANNCQDAVCGRWVTHGNLSTETVVLCENEVHL